MVAFSSSRTKNAVRRGAVGFALALPLISVLPLQAQAEDIQLAAEAEAVDPQGVEAEITEEQIEVEQIEITPDPAATPVAEPIDEGPELPRVLITEVIIEGIDGHPEQERLELAAYDAMRVRPGSRVTREELKLDLDDIYATGWFSDVRIEPVNGPLGVQLAVQVVPNPVMTEVVLEPEDNKIEPQVIEDTFSSDYGRTLNLNELQLRMKQLQI